MSRPFRILTKEQALSRSSKLTIPTNLKSQLENKSFFTSRVSTFDSNPFSILSTELTEVQTTSLRSEITEEETFIKTRKVRLKLNKEQRRIIRQWFRMSRITYNSIINSILNKSLTRIKLYDLFNSYVRDSPNYLKVCPSDIRRYSCKEVDSLVKAYITRKKKELKEINIKNKQQNKPLLKLHLDITEIKFKFKSSKQPTSIGIDKDNIFFRDNFLSIYPRKFKDKNIVIPNKKSRELLSIIQHDCRLTMNKLGHIFLVIPISYNKNNSQLTNQFISLDPGVRTFQTTYSNTGIIKEYGLDVRKKLSQLDKKINSSKNYRQLRLKEKKKNLVNDLHYSVINDLVTSSSHIFIPKFGVKEIISNEGSLFPQTKRDLLNLSHYKFRIRLIEKSLANSIHIYVVNESYTSRTCGVCFKEYNIGSSKLFSCKYCGYSCDRDINAARNIMIKCIS